MANLYQRCINASFHTSWQPLAEKYLGLEGSSFDPLGLLLPNVNGQPHTTPQPHPIISLVCFQ